MVVGRSLDLHVGSTCRVNSRDLGVEPTSAYGTTYVPVGVYYYTCRSTTCGGTGTMVHTDAGLCRYCRTRSTRRSTRGTTVEHLCCYVFMLLMFKLTNVVKFNSGCCYQARRESPPLAPEPHQFQMVQSTPGHSRRGDGWFGSTPCSACSRSV